jgi:hypothetical protein
MSEDIRDVDTFFDDDSGQKEQFSELLKTVQRRAKNAADDILEKARKANEIVLDKLENNIKLSSIEKRDILDHEQNILRKKLMSELVQTKASMILVKNQSDKLKRQNEKLIPRAAIETGYEQVISKGKIKSNNSMMLKLQLQQQYLEGIFSELSTALQKLKEMILVDRVTPIASNISDLLSEVDRIQAESNYLAGRVEEAEAEAQALKDLEEEL